MGEGENKKEEGTLKDGDGREPEAKKKKQSKSHTSSESDEEEEEEDEEASVQMCSVVMQQLSLTVSHVGGFFHRRKTKAERNTQKWTKRCGG